MKKFMKRWMPLLLTLMVCVGTFWSSVVPVYASMADEAMDYTMGETYRGQHWYSKYYSFTLKERTHMFFKQRQHIQARLIFTFIIAMVKSFWIAIMVTI